MKLLKAEKQNSLYELEIAVEKEVFNAAIEKVYRRQVKNINIPERIAYSLGFTNGEFPREVFESWVGVFNDIVGSIDTEAIVNNAIKK